MAGMPFLAAHIGGPLYPPNVALLALLRPVRALEVHAVAHIVLAGLLSWLFARRLRLGAAASLAASASYMLSGAILAMFYSVAYVSTCAWLPGVLWAVHGLVTEARARWAVALSFVLALAFLGGHAQGVLFEAQLGFAYGATALAFRVPAGRRQRVAVLGAVSGALVVGLVAAQLLPTLELLQTVSRAREGLGFAEASDFSDAPGDVLGGLLGRGTRFATTLFALPLLVCGFWDRGRRHQWLFFAVAAVVTALFALGDRTPVFRIYFALPGGDLFRFPYRIAFVYAFCASVLVGIGVQGAQALGQRWQPRARRLPAALGALIAFGVIADLCAPGRLTYALPIPPQETRGAPDELLAELAARRGEGRVFIENFGAYYAAVMPYLSGMMNEGFFVPTYEPMIPSAYTAYFGQDRLWRGFVNVVPLTQARKRSFFRSTRTAAVDTFPPGALERILDLMSVRFYATHAELAGRRLPALERFVGDRATTLGPVRLLERRQALPRTYVVHEAIVEPDPERARQRIQSAAFAPRRQVVSGLAIPGLEVARPDARTAEWAEIRSYAGEEVAIEAACASACLLVLTDLDYPGWEAQVDGRPSPIHRVNALFRAVRLPAGRHEVVYRYRPLSFRIGAAVSIATLAALLSAFAVHRLRARRAVAPPANAAQ
jgi:hypothetical protein